MIQKINDKISILFTEDGFMASNNVLVEDDIRLMIDSGSGSILKTASPETVDLLLITHHHFDHINGNDQFTKATIMAHPVEKKAMQSPEKTTATEGWDQLMKKGVLSYSEELGGINQRVLQPWHVDKELHDNQVIKCGNTEIIVLLTPGHTAGHCSFYFPEEDFIFTGDICLTKVGPWYGDMDTTIEQFINSIDRLLDLNPRLLTTGHTTYLLSENIRGKLIKYRDRIYKREKRILNLLKEGPASLDQIADKKPIYPMHPTNFVLFWEKSMIKKHLELLTENMLVKKTEDGRYMAV